ncbi:hypothetical protein W97_06723 [Coniosporium apollinis CBS 100218]|uniref:PAC domain-containing protein n=1 Tax=Coniosporium apollinis (strain CBS 100218) TaxID=1168221 RepID=R7Z093_CONA1|nr:uncharacterized protein W97_06723 [Coniosporium apollinis CBS 100218]EON67469.1 hypothetical protein W97_06723 [Coniosporium apollinis CBS 100218]
MSSFTHLNLVPENFPRLDPEPGEAPYGNGVGMSYSPSVSSRGAPSIFDREDIAEEYAEKRSAEITQATSQQASSPDEPSSYDLKPPPPSVSHANGERLAERLFSIDHLDLILRDHTLSRNFTTFLNRYRPLSSPVLVRYLEAKKATAAVEYANAVAAGSLSFGSSPATAAATVDSRFESRARRAVDELTSDALPAYITHQLVKIVTECLVKEITGSNAPVMRELVQGVAEVYCLSDPSLPDNPLVYASEEFYRTTQYGREYVIGKNCRFLQGPKTSPSTVSRFAEALAQGEEICETLLNYRRDGSPFLNLCLIAPLYDNKGKVRYFLGCQVDVTNLIDGGRGMESFQRLLAEDRGRSRAAITPKSSLKALSELGEMLTNDEMDVIQNRGRAGSAHSGASTPVHPATRPSRRILGMEDQIDTELWPAAHHGPSGRLPGVYQNFLLVRPYPSLRITFTSAALRIPGLLQSRFLDRIGGPTSLREGIAEAFASGVSVTAKISWLTNVNPGDATQSNVEGRPRWIHCTPMMGSDEKVGVWMVVMVEREDITGSINAHVRNLSISQPTVGAGSKKFTGNKLYAQYLRREGQGTDNDSMMSGRVGSGRASASPRHQRPRGMDDHFRDF